ncbi:MAG: FixH family protein [Alphaproteobacteria bacterium]|nr:FixH family protein [Alphaproteobacteria bacterium]
MTRDTGAWTGRTFLAWIIGFFAVIFAVNGVFIWFASDSWSGLSAENSYRRGVDFNRTLERAERQSALGWKVAATFEAETALRGRLIVAAEGPGGQPIEQRDVTAAFVRPVAEGLDFTVPLKAQPGGVYLAEVDLPVPGQWDVRAEISRPGAEPYIVETRIWSR